MTWCNEQGRCWLSFKTITHLCKPYQAQKRSKDKAENLQSTDIDRLPHLAPKNIENDLKETLRESLNKLPKEVKEIITTSDMGLGDVGIDNIDGAGPVNVESAVRRSHALSLANELANLHSNREFLA